MDRCNVHTISIYGDAVRCEREATHTGDHVYRYTYHSDKMNTSQNNETNQEWADFTSGSSYMRARDYKIGDKITVDVIKYNGMEPIKNTVPLKHTPAYTVSVDGNKKKFNLNATNAGELAKRKLADSFDSVVGLRLTLLVAKTNAEPTTQNPQSLGFQLIDAVRKSAKKQPKEPEPEPEPDEEY